MSSKNSPIKSVSRDHYYRLASDLEAERISSATQLIKELQELDDEEQYQYALDRLIKGLSSSRASARLGFSMCLGEILLILIKEKKNLNVQGYLKLLDSTLAKINGSNNKGKYERSYLFGKLFGIQSLINSDVIDFTDSSNDETDDNIDNNENYINLTLVLNELIDLSLKKSWIRESIFGTIFNTLIKFKIFENLSTNKINYNILLNLLNKIHENNLTLTIESLLIYINIPLEFQQKLINDSIINIDITNGNTNKYWKYGNPLAKVNINLLAKVLKDNIVSNNEPNGENSINPNNTDSNGNSKNKANNKNNAIKLQKSNWSSTLHMCWLPLLHKIIIQDAELESNSIAKPLTLSSSSSSPSKKKKSKIEKSKKSNDTNNIELINLQEFWKICIDESFFSIKSSPERKFLGFEIFIKLLSINELEPSKLSILLSPNLLRTLINQSSNNDRLLNKIAKNVLNELVIICKNNNEKTIPVLNSFLKKSNGGNINFDKITKSKTIFEIIQNCSIEDGFLLKTIKLLSDLQNDSNIKDKQELIGIKIFILDTYLQIIRSKKINTSNLSNDSKFSIELSKVYSYILNYLVEIAFLKKKDDESDSKLDDADKGEKEAKNEGDHDHDSEGEEEEDNKDVTGDDSRVVQIAKERLFSIMSEMKLSALEISIDDKDDKLKNKNKNKNKNKINGINKSNDDDSNSDDQLGTSWPYKIVEMITKYDTDLNNGNDESNTPEDDQDLLVIKNEFEGELKDIKILSNASLLLIHEIKIALKDLKQGKKINKSKINKILPIDKLKNLDLNILECLEILFSVSLLQLYSGDSDSAGILNDLQVACNSYVFDKNEDDEEMDNDVDNKIIVNMIIDLMLYYTSQKSKLLKTVSYTIWDLLISFVDNDELNRIFEILLTKENKEGQMKLFNIEEEAEYIEEGDEEEDEHDHDHKHKHDDDEEEDEEEDDEEGDGDAAGNVSTDDNSKKLDEVDSTTNLALAKALGIPTSAIAEGEAGDDSNDDDEDSEDSEDDDDDDQDSELIDDDNDDDEDDDEEMEDGDSISFPGAVTLSDLDSDDDDEIESDVESMSDEQMLAIDSQLSQIFQQRREAINTLEDSSKMTGNQRKLDVQNAKEMILFFKNRLLDLLEKYNTVYPNKFFNVFIVLNLLDVMKLTTDKQLSEKIHRILKSKFFKNSNNVLLKGIKRSEIEKPSGEASNGDDDTTDEKKQEPEKDNDEEVDSDYWLSLLKDVHSKASSSPFNSHSLACNQSSIFISKLIFNNYKDEDSLIIDKIIDIYSSSLKNWSKTPSNKIQPSLYFDLINWLNSRRK
ncbi:hypothetical protein B5S30_g694 [[Candida] boidinii]|nr:hypothetical protein B5S30_g694 [[Candida] boidinii]